MSRARVVRIAAAAGFVAAAVACSQHASTPAAGEASLARVGLATLTRAELLAAMPSGLSTDDSTRFARAFVRNWIDTRLIEDVAAEQVDMERIDAMVQQYRRDLILRDYRDRRFAAEAAGMTFSDSVIADYYERHSAELTLDRPLIRGVYIKLPDESKDLKAIRNLYRSAKPADIDRLEKEVLGQAIHYDYFRDRWIEWEQVESRIPYDFGANPAEWLRTQRNLDVSLGGFTYLLEVSDVLPAGSPMPLQAARPVIEERLTAERRRAYDSALRTRLYDESLASGRLTLGCDL